MSWYLAIKTLHITTACITALLMLLRLSLDAVGAPGWRRTPLKWIPHVNDTLLLVSALTLLYLTGWIPFLDHWLTGKILLLVGYIAAGKWALDQNKPTRQRLVASLLALAQLAVIFALAFHKPLL